MNTSFNLENVDSISIPQGQYSPHISIIASPLQMYRPQNQSSFVQNNPNSSFRRRRSNFNFQGGAPQFLGGGSNYSYRINDQKINKDRFEDSFNQTQISQFDNNYDDENQENLFTDINRFQQVTPFLKNEQINEIQAEKSNSRNNLKNSNSLNKFSKYLNTANKNININQNINIINIDDDNNNNLDNIIEKNKNKNQQKRQRGRPKKNTEIQPFNKYLPIQKTITKNKRDISHSCKSQNIEDYQYCQQNDLYYFNQRDDYKKINNPFENSFKIEEGIKKQPLAVGDQNYKKKQQIPPKKQIIKPQPIKIDYKDSIYHNDNNTKCKQDAQQIGRLIDKMTQEEEEMKNLHQQYVRFNSLFTQQRKQNKTNSFESQIMYLQQLKSVRNNQELKENWAEIDKQSPLLNNILNDDSLNLSNLFIKQEDKPINIRDENMLIKNMYQNQNTGENAEAKTILSTDPSLQNKKQQNFLVQKDIFQEDSENLRNGLNSYDYSEEIKKFEKQKNQISSNESKKSSHKDSRQSSKQQINEREPTFNEQIKFLQIKEIDEKEEKQIESSKDQQSTLQSKIIESSIRNLNKKYLRRTSQGTSSTKKSYKLQNSKPIKKNIPPQNLLSMTSGFIQGQINKLFDSKLQKLNQKNPIKFSTGFNQDHNFANNHQNSNLIFNNNLSDIESHQQMPQVLNYLDNLSNIYIQIGQKVQGITSNLRKNYINQALQQNYNLNLQNQQQQNINIMNLPNLILNHSQQQQLQYPPNMNQLRNIFPFTLRNGSIPKYSQI